MISMVFLIRRGVHVMCNSLEDEEGQGRENYRKS